jgi:hypothetical protein
LFGTAASFGGVIGSGFGRGVTGGSSGSEGVAGRPRKSQARQSLDAGVVQFCRRAQGSGL